MGKDNDRRKNDEGYEDVENPKSSSNISLENKWRK